MKSEFSSFLVKIQIQNTRTPTLFEQDVYQYTNPQLIRDNLSHLFERIMQIAHKITDEKQLKREVVQVQILMTELINMYQYQTVSQAILQKLIKFLEALQEEFPNEFNDQADYPRFAYSLIEPELKAKQNELLSLLSQNKVDQKLINILKRYFNNIAGRHRSQPSWKHIQYLEQIMDELSSIVQNTDSKRKSMEVELLRVFIRNNFNKQSIISYWHNRFDEMFEEPYRDQESCTNYLLLTCDSIAYQDVAYDKNAVSFQEQFRTILNARKKYLADETERALKSANESSTMQPVYINAPAEIIGLFFRVAFDVSFIKKPHPLKYFFSHLLRVIRGPKGNIFELSTLQKASSVENVSHIDRLIEYLQQMINRLKEIRERFLTKKN